MSDESRSMNNINSENIVESDLSMRSHVCSLCGKHDAEGHNTFVTCVVCRSTWYCSLMCRQAARLLHSSTCRYLKDSSEQTNAAINCTDKNTAEIAVQFNSWCKQLGPWLFEQVAAHEHDLEYEEDSVSHALLIGVKWIARVDSAHRGTSPMLFEVARVRFVPIHELSSIDARIGSAVKRYVKECGLQNLVGGGRCIMAVMHGTTAPLCSIQPLFLGPATAAESAALPGLSLDRAPTPLGK